ncbi:hypothetical protein, partial [Negativibacillus massiliensis]|uniref:hypothetical protein n=1 Tax=Negativibacillus massiliensis TaxID=1871035 RepID=UPI003AF2A0AC
PQARYNAEGTAAPSEKYAFWASRGTALLTSGDLLSCLFLYPKTRIPAGCHPAGGFRCFLFYRLFLTDAGTQFI